MRARSWNKSRDSEPAIRWTPTPAGLVAINVDASVREVGFMAGFGGVIRDHHASFIFGFSMKLESCSIIEVEMWALYHNICMLKGRGLQGLVVQYDSQEAIDLVVNGLVGLHSLSHLIDSIREIVNEVLSVRWSNISRDQNKVVDALAKFSSSLFV